ncbi:hypothetical protein prwr041_20740 [Prevotella herbatica]|uniref:Uncharacterized protein n=1 Tax=Prevotella herbatica TaxID=2801997 RepID=A0ABM7P0B0_9BACT|nr:hypothetical protein prwr041_20740 [Prevotella herbatica]
MTLSEVETCALEVLGIEMPIPANTHAVNTCFKLFIYLFISYHLFYIKSQVDYLFL